MTTLVESAKKVSVRRKRRARYDDKQLRELALAWVTGQISFTQARTAMGLKGSDIYSYLALGLQSAYQQGTLKIKS